jgi:hypothetical protein
MVPSRCRRRLLAALPVSCLVPVQICCRARAGMIEGAPAGRPRAPGGSPCSCCPALRRISTTLAACSQPHAVSPLAAPPGSCPATPAPGAAAAERIARRTARDSASIGAVARASVLAGGPKGEWAKGGTLPCRWREEGRIALRAGRVAGGGPRGCPSASPSGVPPRLPRPRAHAPPPSPPALAAPPCSCPATPAPGAAAAGRIAQVKVSLSAVAGAGARALVAAGGPEGEWRAGRPRVGGARRGARTAGRVGWRWTPGWSLCFWSAAPPRRPRAHTLPRRLPALRRLLAPARPRTRQAPPRRSASRGRLPAGKQRATGVTRPAMLATS